MLNHSHWTIVTALSFIFLAIACSRGKPRVPSPQVSIPAAPLPHDPNGEADGERAINESSLRALAAGPAKFVSLGHGSGAHPLVCDIVAHAGALFVSTATQPIGKDGALIHRWDVASGVWSMAFDWDRGGAPDVTHEVGGQGITRIRVLEGRLWATDADAPLFGGFGLSPAPLEDYIFVSQPDGTFDPLGPEMSPPPSTRIVLAAFHTFDVIDYRGERWATGGTLAMGAEPKSRYPGGMFRQRPEGFFLPAFTVGEDMRVGVVRTTYTHRFAGRLLVGFQNNGRRLRDDLLVLNGDPSEPKNRILLRVVPDAGALTLRFASTRNRLLWVGAVWKKNQGLESFLYEANADLVFSRVPLPPEAGYVHDIEIVGDTAFVLTRAGVFAAPLADFSRAHLLAKAPKGDPFGARDAFCSAPLVASGNALYAGSTRDGGLWRVESVAP